MVSSSKRLLLLLTTSTCLFIKKASGFAFTDALVDFSLGAVAGGIGAFVAYPVDYVTCQMQTSSGKQKYKNGVDCFLQTVQQGGPSQLFRGVNVQVAGVAPEKAIKLGVNDMVKGMLTGCFGGVTLWGEIFAGSVAGICQVVATSPLEVLKVGLQTSNTTIDELMVEIGGLPGLFRGAEACILRDVVLSATLFPIYTHAHEVLPAFAAGSIAGVAAGIVGAPPDFIKTRIMARDGTANFHQQPRLVPAFSNPFLVEYRSDGDVLYANQMINSYAYKRSDEPTTNPFVVGSDIVKREGWEVLFTGVAERCVASIPRYGVTLAMYDALKHVAASNGWMGLHDAVTAAQDVVDVVDAVTTSI